MIEPEVREIPPGIAADGESPSASESLGSSACAGPSPYSDPEKIADQFAATVPRRSSWKPVSFHLVFLSLLIMVLLVSLDATILAVALPAIAHDLRGTALQSFWTSICFTLAVVVARPIYTSVSNVMGRKATLYTAFVLFAVGSVIFAVAPNMGALILGRVLQGLGGGGLDVLSEVIVADMTTLKERAFWIGLLSVPMAAGCILGPILGGIFREYASWRWIGWINLPLIAFALVLAVLFMRLKPLDRSHLSHLARIDWIGMAMFTIGCTLVSLHLSWGGNMYPWTSWRTLVPLVVGVVAVGAFAIYETTGGSRFSLPHIQAVFLETALQSALSILPFCVLVMVFTGVAAWVVDYLRHYRWEIWLGWILLSVGTGLFALWHEAYGGTSIRAASAGFRIIAGIGIGTIFTVPCIPMQASAKPADQGLAIGIMVSFRLFGALVGLSVGSATFNNGFARAIAEVGPLPESLSQLINPNDAIALIPNLRSANVSDNLLYAIRGAYRIPMRDIWIILAASGALGFLSSLLIEEMTLETEELGDQHYEF